MRSIRFTVLMLLSTAVLAGCATKRRDDQLGKVAKEWSKTIRASQVIPIYPLSEDLQPGDCFIVSVPTEDEQRMWEEEGFLPLTNHIMRLDLGMPSGPLAVGLGPTTRPGDRWRRMYPQESYGIGAADAPSPAWLWQQQPPTVSGATAAPAGQRYALRLPLLGTITLIAGPDLPPRHRAATAWRNAPRASFPSFSISVDTTTAADLSVPIHGLPFALSAINAQKATASVTLSDAYTYGISIDQIFQLLAERTNHPSVRGVLAPYEPRRIWDGTKERAITQYSYLRVVYRVYHVGAVDVSVQSQANTGLAAALFQKAEQLPTTQQAARRERELSRLNDALDSIKQNSPGGTLSVTDRTSRSISLRQEFDRPLVVGYLSIDFPIGPAGALSRTPIATEVKLDRGKMIDTVAEWAALNPDAEAELTRWLSGEQSRIAITRAGWQQNGDSFSPTNESKRLISYLATPWWLRTVWPPYIVGGYRDEWRKINQLILEDVIRRPYGLPPEVPVTETAGDPLMFETAGATHEPPEDLAEWRWTLQAATRPSQ